MRVRVAGTVVAESMRALRLERLLERLKNAWRLIRYGTPDAVGPSRWGDEMQDVRSRKSPGRNFLLVTLAAGICFPAIHM